MGCWGSIYALALVGLLIAGCADPRAYSGASGTGFSEVAGVTNGHSVNAAGGAPLPSIKDEIQIGDSLVISFSDLVMPITPIEELVRQDGTITLLLNQRFLAAGKTRGELEQEIHKFYVPDYYKQMTVYIKPADRWFFVDGEVKVPSRCLYIGPMTVKKAIASSGGFTDYAKRAKVKLIHPDGSSEIIDCRPKSDPRKDPPVYPGDTVRVPKRFW